MIADTNSKIEIDANGNLARRTNATWTTEDTEDSPDPDVEVLNENICLRPIKLGNKIKTKSGFELIAPDKTVDQQERALTVARVVGVGETACQRAGVSKVSKGDYVLIPKYGGAPQIIQGVKVIFMPDDAIFARVKPEDISLDVTI